MLNTTIRLKNQSSNVGLLRDFEGSVYEMNDIAHVQVQNETCLQGAILGFGPNIFESL